MSLAAEGVQGCGDACRQGRRRSSGLSHMDSDMNGVCLIQLSMAVSHAASAAGRSGEGGLSWTLASTTRSSRANLKEIAPWQRLPSAWPSRMQQERSAAAIQSDKMH